jgi:methylmalonyl-CoA/ethylmalonyl-CoA epimerase
VDVRSLHHVAVAVADLDAAIGTYQRLFGAEIEVRERMEHEGVEAAYLRLGGARVELLAPLGPDSSVGRFLERRGPGLHHLAVDVPDVTAALGELAAAGADVVDSEPRLGLDGSLVGFVHPDSLHGVLAEVVSTNG